jgi:SAM-dependent methyltransferase
MENNRKFDDFDSFAQDYRTIHTENIKISGESSEYFAEFKLKWLSEKVDNKAFQFLDFGCGDGALAQWFYQYFPQAHYFGVDISAESIAVAKNKNIKGAQFEVFDGIKLPFPDNTFDSCMAACVFHHIDASLHGEVLKEILRVLKPQGIFYLWEHNPYNPITRKVVAACEFDKDCVLLTPKYAKSIIKGGHFSEFKMNYVIFMPRSSFFKRILGIEKYFSAVPLGAQYVLSASK